LAVVVAEGIILAQDRQVEVVVVLEVLAVALLSQAAAAQQGKAMLADRVLAMHRMQPAAAAALAVQVVAV
jgi:hypothetical protein